MDQTPIYDQLLAQLRGGHLSAAAALPWTPGNPPTMDLFRTTPGGGRRVNPTAPVSAGGRHHIGDTGW